MKKNNQGITLIELIVVIAIMSVLTATLAISMSYIGKQKVSNAASSTKQLLQLAQTYAKSKGACKMTIEGLADGGCNMYVYTAAKESDLANNFKYGNGPSNINKKITTKVYFDYNGTTYAASFDISSIRSLDIRFNRSTGGFTESYLYEGTGASKSLKYKGVPSKIEFTNGDRVISLVLAKNTGVVTYSYNN